MPRIFNRKPQLILVILVAVLALLIFIGGRYKDRLSFVEGIVGDIITPVQGFMYRIATDVSGFFTSIGERRQLEENYAKLKERVKELEQLQLNMDEIIRENERLKSLLDFKKEHDEYVVTGARVTGKNPSSWFNTITINKGAKHGVKVDMAVVTDKGLVGRVTEVGSSWAKVRTIIDGQSSVSGIIERTRDTGMVRGNNTMIYEDGLCRMMHLPLDADVVVGDRVITSGLGGIFPKGLYIGEIIEVSSESHDSYVTAIIRPGVDFLHLEEVLVIAYADE